jgi:hypothetical protein
MTDTGRRTITLMLCVARRGRGVQMNDVDDRKVLVFLPSAGAEIFTPQLGSAGYDCTVVSELEELAYELASERYWLVVTIRQDIDVVRQINPLPVINIEIFFHSQPSSITMPSKSLDVEALLKRVGDLYDLMAAKRGNQRAAEKLPGPDAIRGPSRITTLVKTALAALRRKRVSLCATSDRRDRIRFS